MRDSADMDGMPNVKSRRAFFSGEIVAKITAGDKA